MQVADAFDGAPVELDHDVADADAGAGGGSGLEQLDDLQAACPAKPVGNVLPERAGPADDAEERAPDATVDDQALDDPARGAVDRDREARDRSRPRPC